MQNLADIRKDYRLMALDEASCGHDPLLFFQQWLQAAQHAGVAEPTAMTLATADSQGQPHARIVLLKEASKKGLYFFTNYQSDKGMQLQENPRGALLFFWSELERQVRIEGPVSRATTIESDAYYASRPRGSRIGAWASPQSRELHSRTELEAEEARYEAAFKGEEKIPRPPHWGGFVLSPERWEFWQGRSSRLHDRVVFLKEEEGWRRTRLAP